MAVSHPGNRDAAAQQRPHCSNGSVCMNRKTKKFYYLESKVKLIGMKKIKVFWRAQKRLIQFYVLGSSSIWTCRILNFEYRIFVVVFLQAGALEKIKANIQYSTISNR